MNSFSLHPWHGIESEWNGVSAQAIVEIPQGSRIKYELDKSSGIIKMDRLLSSSFEYPLNYGFIPRTLGVDGDPLDILVLTHSPLVPLCIVKSKVIGIMRMIDRGIADDKIVAIAENDVTQKHIQTISDLPKHFFVELQNFFEEYTRLENKKVTIHGFYPLKEASECIDEHIKRYSESSYAHST